MDVGDLGATAIIRVRSFVCSDMLYIWLFRSYVPFVGDGGLSVAVSHP